MHSDKKLNVGIIGTGFIGNGLLNVIRLLPDMQVSAVLTHRDHGGVRPAGAVHRIGAGID